MISAKNLREYSKELKILYVEDDKELRENTSVLLTNLFQKSITAENGVDGLEKYKKEIFDIVITDINMPILNGIDMIKEIKKIHPEEVIIVTSAHDEVEYLISLIDLGVDSFILKPIELQKLLNILFKTSRNIVDRKLLLEYENKLEENILELNEKNEELAVRNGKLEKLNRVLELKLKQLSNCVEEENKFLKKIENESFEDIKEQDKVIPKNENSEDNYLDYILDNDLEELKDLEVEIDAITSMISLKGSIEIEQLKSLSKLLANYSSILLSYPIFITLGSNISNFAKELSLLDSISNDLIKHISAYLESFVYTLLRWRKDVFDDGVSNPNIYDASMINDLNMFLNIIKGIEEEGSGIILF